MKKHTLFTAIALPLMAGLIFCATAGNAFATATNLTDYGWNVINDGANYYWSFNESNAGDLAIDAIRWQANDSLEAKTGATRVAGQTANLGQAASFDGIESVFHADDLQDGQFNGAWAVEMWFQMDDPVNVQEVYLMNIMGNAGGGDCPSVIYGYTPDTVEMFAVGTRTGETGPTVTDTNWHHFVLTYYGNADGYGVADRVDLTYDGVTASVLDGNLRPNMDVGGPLNVGRWTDFGSDAFDGQIDEVAIYNLSGLTLAEVEAKSATIASHRNLINNAPGTSLAIVDAAQVTYTVDPSGTPVHPDIYGDTTGDELSDGLFVNGADNLNDPNSMAFYDPVVTNPQTAEVIFDLSETKTLDSVWIDYLDSNGKWGVKTPDVFELAFSNDGVNFTGDIVIDDMVGEGGEYSYFQAKRQIADTGGVAAQYVRLRVTKDGTFAFMSEVTFIEDLGSVPTFTPGDANKDGTVDEADAAILAANWLSSGASWLMGDFNDDGVVNDADATLMASNWQGAANASVPEPATIIMLAGLLAAFGFIRRKR